MIYTLRGKILPGPGNSILVDASGVGYKVFVTPKTREGFAGEEEGRLFTYYHLRETGAELYGFKTSEELSFFELLISVSGVGPRSGLAIMETADLKDLAAAIQEGRPDLLTQASGIGKKTGERIVVELRGKVGTLLSGEAVKKMEKDGDLVEVLVGLGYRKAEARDALANLGSEPSRLEDRLKEVLKTLNTKK